MVWPAYLVRLKTQLKNSPNRINYQYQKPNPLAMTIILQNVIHSKPDCCKNGSYHSIFLHFVRTWRNMLSRSLFLYLTIVQKSVGNFKPVFSRTSTIPCAISKICYEKVSADRSWIIWRCMYFLYISMT